MNDYRIFGKIFLPEKPDEKINGVWLNISKGSIFLEVPLNSAFSNKDSKIILGEFNGLDKVTFVNTHSSGSSRGLGGTLQKVRVSYLIKDCHIENYTDLLFSRIILTSPALNNWVNEPTGIHQIDDYTFKIPENKEVFTVLIDKVNISLHLLHSIDYSEKYLNIEQKCNFQIESSENLHISDFSELMTRIKKWILFVTNKNPEFSTYYLVNKQSEQFELVNTLEDLNENRFTQNISLSYNDLKESLIPVFENWMKIEKLEIIIDLLQEKNYNTEMTPQSYFLNLCVALESFHSIFIKESDEESIKIRLEDRETIKSLIYDDDLMNRFNDISQSWGKATYRERLNSFKPTIEFLMGNTFSFEFSKMIGKIVNTRNSLAHKGTFKENLQHIELLLIGKVLEFTLKNEILKLLNYKSIRENEVLKNAKRNIEILAKINDYNKGITQKN